MKRALQPYHEAVQICHCRSCHGLDLHFSARPNGYQRLLLQVLPPVFRSIGIYVFDSPPPLVLPLGALLVLTIVVAGLARSSAIMALQDRQASHQARQDKQESELASQV